MYRYKEFSNCSSAQMILKVDGTHWPIKLPLEVLILQVMFLVAPFRGARHFALFNS